MKSVLLNADAYDVIVLGTQKSPGKVTLNGHDRDKNWRIAKAKGQVGASSSLDGDDLGEFEATFDLGGDGYTEDELKDELEQWDDFQRLIESTTNGPKPTALPIYHPDLARNRYTEVVNRGVGGVVHDGKGGAQVKVKFGEHRPPKPKPIAKPVSKPAQTYATTDEGRRSPPDPNAAAKQQLAGLLDQARQP
jgi:hypothetical protein